MMKKTFCAEGLYSLESTTFNVKNIWTHPSWWGRGKQICVYLDWVTNVLCFSLSYLPPPQGGGALPNLKMVENFHSIDPCFFTFFRSHWVPFLCPTRSYWPPLSAEKIGLSLSHLVPDIIWPKVGLFFTNICHLTLLKQFVPIFSLIFVLVDHLFHYY